MSHDVFKDHQVLEVAAKDLKKADLQRELLAKPCTQKICVIFEGDETEFPGFLISLKTHFEKVYFAIRASRKARLDDFSAQAPHWLLQELHVLPSAFEAKRRETLTCSETRKFVQKIREKGGLAKPLPYRDFEKSEKSKKPGIIQWQTQCSQAPFFSVVIPTRNNEDFLVNVVAHLFQQDLDTHDYEILVVDDGGKDQSLKKLQGLLGPLSGQINFKYIYCPRYKENPQEFNAGYCRNQK